MIVNSLLNRRLGWPMPVAYLARSGSRRRKTYSWTILRRGGLPPAPIPAPLPRPVLQGSLSIGIYYYYY